ncbi:hypothetical protein C7H83_12730 [Tetragenococcus halophilus]|uniref:Uncharacterized protein n=1 Tax=Tetragenococcus halophilus TaxID=51669 RepID=A0A3G5FLQ9_TETHA|nr:hypothetical protein [Tetragenococcus halophilus]AYW51264.1 hypothetical protein C7H83_12730 [Tetragenococcus halophilus]GBD63923.1 putative polysaccharide biosynthesis protein [Tetragenococcus halophilus subsp. flandriensis]
MEKSGQRQQNTLRKVLDKLRELALVFFSLLLWGFSLLAFLTIIFTLLGVDLYYVQLIRTVLKITRLDLMDLIHLNLIVGAGIVVYLTVTYYFGLFKQRGGKIKENEKAK